MGMDVYGKAKKESEDEPGAYFRNNCWWWRPLASFITTFGPQEIVSKCQYWQSNAGDGLDEEDSITLAKWLQEQIDNGKCKEFEKSRTVPGLDNTMYPFSVENVQEFINFLRSCGGFEIW